MKVLEALRNEILTTTNPPSQSSNLLILDVAQGRMKGAFSETLWIRVEPEVGWLFCFMVYQPFSGHLTPNYHFDKSFKQFSLV